MEPMKELADERHCIEQKTFVQFWALKFGKMEAVFFSIHAILQAKPPGYSVEFSKLWCANSRSGARIEFA